MSASARPLRCPTRLPVPNGLGQVGVVRHGPPLGKQLDRGINWQRWWHSIEEVAGEKVLRKEDG